MDDFAALAARMDAQVDNRLGDSISYSIAGAPFVTIKGFVIEANPGDDEAAQAYDSLPRNKRVKVAVSLVPRPTPNDRITADLLGPGIFRPRNAKPRVAGRYNIFDVERV